MGIEAAHGRSSIVHGASVLEVVGKTANACDLLGVVVE